MAECVLDANVLVAWIDSADSLHVRAHDLLKQLEEDGTEPVLLDVLVAEAVSVLCRRFRERRQRGDLAAMLAEFRRRIDPSTNVRSRARCWKGAPAGDAAVGAQAAGAVPASGKLDERTCRGRELSEVASPPARDLAIGA